MGLIDLLSIAILAIYAASFSVNNIFLSIRHGISVDVLGKEAGSKDRTVVLLERFLKGVTYTGFAVWLTNALLPRLTETWFIRLYENQWMALIGICISAAGLCIFIWSMLWMKTSWRAGIDKKAKTALVTSGIYRFSRNPAFVGMDLMFWGLAATYIIVVTIFMALLVMIFIHVQIQQEEEQMKQTFGQSWLEYAQCTPRYLVAGGRSVGK